MKNKLINLYEVDIIYSVEDNCYVAQVPELDGCITHGKTREIVLKNIYEAMELWIETANEEGIPIPEPISKRSFSGHFNVRVGKELHRKLAVRAVKNRSSLNAVVSNILAQTV